jgi:hypothetical protein
VDVGFYASTGANFCGYLFQNWNKSPTQKVWISHIQKKKLKALISDINQKNFKT